MQPFICGVPNITAEGAAREEAAWPKRCRKLAVFIDWRGFDAGTAGLPKETARESFHRAWQSWDAKIDFEQAEVQDPTNADIVLDWDRLDRNVLAWAHVGDGTCNSRRRRFNNRIRWSAHGLYVTEGHESGHTLGLLHSPERILMFWQALWHLDGPQDKDVANAVGLGYERDATRPPPPDPDAAQRLAQVRDLMGTLERAELEAKEARDKINQILDGATSGGGGGWDFG